MKIICPECFEGNLFWNEVLGCYQCDECNNKFELIKIDKGYNE